MAPFPTVGVKRLLLRCPTGLQTDFDAPNEVFETFAAGSLPADNYLILLVHPNNYKEVKTYGSSGTGHRYSRSFASPLVMLRSYQRETEIVVADERNFFYDIVQEIARSSISTDLLSHTPVRMIDFGLPESLDRRNAIATSTSTTVIEPFTVREGLITDITANGGTVGFGYHGSITGGFSFRFIEILLRI